MSDQSRRRFLFASSGAAAGSLLIPGLVDAAHLQQEDDLFAGSGLITGERKALKHDSIPGFLSAKQIAPHHTAHYGGALKGYVSADEKIEETVIESHISKLRKKLKSLLGHDPIDSQRFLGYCWVPQTAPRTQNRPSHAQAFAA